MVPFITRVCLKDSCNIETFKSYMLQNLHYVRAIAESIVKGGGWKEFYSNTHSA